MSRFKIMSAFFALALLSGCATGPRSPNGGPLTWAPRPKINVVNHQRFVHPVRFAPAMARPAKPEIELLAAFLAKHNVQPGDQIMLKGGTAKERLSVMRALARLGLTDATEARFNPAASTQTVLVVVDHYWVTPPANCPDWSKPASADFSNTVDSNYGCANVYDLGQMVADPHDLLQGRTLGPADAAEGVNGIERYQAGKVSFGSGGSGGGNGQQQQSSSSSNQGGGTQ